MLTKFKFYNRTGLLFAFGLAVSGLLLTANASWAENINGYLDARLGMSMEELEKSFPNDGITVLKKSAAGGDGIVQAQRYQGKDLVKLVYGFTGVPQQLALINVYYANRRLEKIIFERLQKRYGSALEDKSTKALFAPIEKDFGTKIDKLNIIVTTGGKDGRVLRFIRTKTFMVLQYFDSAMMSLAK